jgi:hypothetical protein
MILFDLSYHFVVSQSPYKYRLFVLQIYQVNKNKMKVCEDIVN